MYLAMHGLFAAIFGVSGKEVFDHEGIPGYVTGLGNSGLRKTAMKHSNQDGDYPMVYFEKIVPISFHLNLQINE
jgi:hypothetical protein